MPYRPAPWIPPVSRKIPVVCTECGAQHFSVLYIFQTLGMPLCENCLRQKPATVSVIEQE